MTIFPTTKTGQWGFWLTVGFALTFVLKVLFPFPLPSPAIFTIGIAGVVLNVMALFRKERAVLFYVVGGLIGAFVIFWVGGELLFPH